MKSFKQFIDEYLEEGYLTEKNKPTSPEKWARAKAAAKSKFAVYPSAYANAWAAKKYKAMGGGWKSVNEEDELDESTPAWQRKEGKSEKGGLNRKGIASYRRENPGSKLSMAVTTKPSKLDQTVKQLREENHSVLECQE